MTRPDSYWSWISFTSFSAVPRIFDFCGGTTMSSTPIEIAARVAYEKPVYISRSAKITVSLRPSAR